MVVKKPIKPRTKFGRLKVVKELEKRNKDGRIQYECECRCGNTAVVSSKHLRSGHTKSCGCQRSEVARRLRTAHGMTYTRVYRIYRSMLGRCIFPSDTNYYRYGGRGIKVCKRWKGKGGFERFLADMGEPKRGYSIERKNNNKGYSPGNCCWLLRKLQSRNRSNTIYVRVAGKKMSLLEAAECSGLKLTTVHSRYYRGDRGNALFRPREVGVS